MYNSSDMSLSEYIYNYILDMIMQQEIVCGEKIPEEKIVKQLNVSRTPIREALRRLAAEGLVNIYPKRFAEVVVFTEQDIADLGIVRLNNELLAAKLAIHYGSNADFQKLREIDEECRASIEQSDKLLRIKKDAEFHLFLAKIGGNKFLEKFQSQLYSKICLLQSIKYKNDEDSFQKIKHHEGIVNALFERDLTSVKNEIAEHLTSFYNINESNKYFDILNYVYL